MSQFKISEPLEQIMSCLQMLSSNIQSMLTQVWAGHLFETRESGGAAGGSHKTA